MNCKKPSTREPTTSQESDFHFAMPCPVYTVDGMRCVVVYGKIREESRSLRISSVNNIHTAGWDKRWWAHRPLSATNSASRQLSLALCSIHLKGKTFFWFKKKKGGQVAEKTAIFHRTCGLSLAQQRSVIRRLAIPKKKGVKSTEEKDWWSHWNKKKKKK